MNQAAKHAYKNVVHDDDDDAMRQFVVGFDKGDINILCGNSMRLGVCVCVCVSGTRQFCDAI